MLKIKTWRNPYNSGLLLTRPKEVELKEGLTVLVGCNGAGKTTLLHNISEECKNKIPCKLYDNLKDGGGLNVLSSIIGGIKEFDTDSLAMGVHMCYSSEGEAIKANLNRHSTLYDEFFKTGYFKDRSHRISVAFGHKEETIETNKRILMYDATDSGMSIDSIIELKNSFNAILKRAKELEVELYIIISANEYELCNEEDCFDVNSGKYVRFKDYDDYKKFILKSRVNKEKRIKKQIAWREKQRIKEAKEFEKTKGKY